MENIYNDSSLQKQIRQNYEEQYQREIDMLYFDEPRKKFILPASVQTENKE